MTTWTSATPADDPDRSGFQFAEPRDGRAGADLRTATARAAAAEFETDAPLATADEMAYFYVHLEKVLRDVRFLDPDNPRHLMRRLQRLFIRARATGQERSQHSARHPDRHRQDREAHDRT